MSVPHQGMGFRANINLSVCIHAGQRSPVQRCMPDLEHTNLFAGMEHLSVQHPKPAGFHNYVAPSFIVLTGPELVFIEEQEISA